jgi:hypothetical protein
VVIWFRDGRPVTDPWSLRCLLVELAVELEMARRSLPPLRLVPADELEPEWDSEESNAYQDRVEAGLEPEWPDD